MISVNSEYKKLRTIFESNLNVSRSSIMLEDLFVTRSTYIFSNG